MTKPKTLRFKNKHLSLFTVGILAILIYSYKQKITELTFKSYSDVMNKFQIDIPESWNVEKFRNEYSSTIIFADSKKVLENVIIYDIVWDSTKIYMNEHFKRSMDSIVLDKKQELSNQSFDSLNGFTTYRFDAIEFDTLNNVRLIKTHNYIKDYEKDGHLIFTYSRTKNELSKMDSILTEKIMKTIKRK